MSSLDGKWRGDDDELPPALRSMWRLCKLGFSHEPWLMGVAFLLSLLSALPDALLAVWFKLLGDGVMLRFASPVEAVRGVLGLMDAIDAAGLPPAHAGVASGPVVVRDADVYGHTVNLAARIAGHAPSAQLLVTADLRQALAADGIAVMDAGRARLKGVSDEVALLQVVR